MTKLSNIPAECYMMAFNTNLTQGFTSGKKFIPTIFPGSPLINISVYISVKCRFYHFLHKTLNSRTHIVLVFVIKLD